MYTLAPWGCDLEGAIMSPENPPGPPDAKPDNKGAPQPQADVKQLLVVEDVAVLRRAMRKMLESLGYGVVEAADGQEGVSQAKKLKPDLILMDIMLPVMDGVAATRQLKASPETQDIPIVMVTAKGDRSVVLEALKAGAKDFIVKPWTHETIKDKLYKILGKPPEGAG